MIFLDYSNVNFYFCGFSGRGTGKLAEEVTGFKDWFKNWFASWPQNIYKTLQQFSTKTRDERSKVVRMMKFIVRLTVSNRTQPIYEAITCTLCLERNDFPGYNIIISFCNSNISNYLWHPLHTFTLTHKILHM